MSPVTISAAVALSVAIGYGWLVFLMNSKRPMNQIYLILSLVQGAWLVCVWFIIGTRTPTRADFLIRQATALAVLVPTAFNMLRLAVNHPHESCWRAVLRSRWILALNVGLILLCWMPPLIKSVTIAEAGGPGASLPAPVYGHGFTVFVAYYASFFGFLIYAFIRDGQRARGMQQTELHFLLLGSATCIFTGTCLVVIVPLLTQSSYAAQFAPMAVIFLNVIIAYGIARHRIMDVTFLIRRVTAYALLLTYLVGLYFIVWGAGRIALTYLGHSGHFIPHLLAALATAFSMAPVHGRMQEFAKSMFVSLGSMDMAETVRRAATGLDSITTLDGLLARFADVVSEATQADRVLILLRNGAGFAQAYPAPGDIPLRMASDDALATLLVGSKEPLAAYALERLRPTEAVQSAARRIDQLHTAIAIGIHSTRAMEGVMLLGPRLSGGIYGVAEQDTLQVLCNQLAVALENAKLYTVLQNTSIYNEILLDSLVSGIVAAGVDRVITVCNREAQRITGLDARQVIGRPIDVLPEVVARTLDATLKHGTEVRDEFAVLMDRSGEETSLRLSSAMFSGHEGKRLGALLVLSDVTELRRLEQQVRRTDRLSSLGTLAAGMAHEIKNPLVSIKTFTQLLPDRYTDEDFRNTFFNLMGDEVQRIDSIVNRLLNFSRPAPAAMVPTNLHRVLGESLHLVEEESKRNDIELRRDFTGDSDRVLGDPALLKQAFINFFLNAIQAMEKGGRLTTSTVLVGAAPAPFGGGQRGKHAGRRIQVSIIDTGSGIAPDALGKIFDPFYTTKSNGTGMGLAVAHGIIAEHDGIIDVESDVGKGTTFRLVFPLSEETAGA